MFLSALTLLLLTQKGAPHELVGAAWRTQVPISPALTLKATMPLSRARIERVKGYYTTIFRVFFEQFEPGHQCKTPGHLEIRIIESAVLTSKTYFEAAEPTNFGRYFNEGNILYVTPELFSHPEYLAHEMGHYFYDECDWGETMFDNDDEEHARVYAFQDFFAQTLAKSPAPNDDAQPQHSPNKTSSAGSKSPSDTER